MLNYDRHGNFGIIWDTAILLVIVAPPLETLLTRFRKLQPSPLEVGDHLIIGIPVESSEYSIE